MFNFPRNDDSLPPPTGRTPEPSSDVQSLRGDVERLYLIAEALWRILKDKHGLDDQEIVRQIATIDLEDGKLDGRKAKNPPQPCPKCGRILTRQRNKCLFCGEYVALDPFAR